MAIPSRKADEIATQTREDVPDHSMWGNLWGGSKQVYQDKTHGVQAQSLSEPVHKSLDPRQTEETHVESTEDLTDGAQPIPWLLSEQTQETNPATDDAEHAAIVYRSSVASSEGNDGAIEDATSAGTEKSRDANTRAVAQSAVVENRPAKVATENCVQTQGEDNDNWLDDWDLVIRRCVHCGRAFGTQQRVEDHLRRQHAPGSEPLEPYPAPNRPESAKVINIEPPLVKIVENGDLILDVQLHSNASMPRKRFQVASQALWAASPVFNAMFGPTSKFQERVNIRRANVFGCPPSGISVPDGPDAMECVLNVLFHRRSSLPTTYTFSDVLNIAIVTDKYEMQDVMGGWAEPLLPQVETWAAEPGHENALFISWVFGYDAVFEELFTSLTLHSQIVKGSFFLPPPAVALCEHTPSVVLRELVNVRHKRVKIMRKIIKAHHRYYVLETNPGHSTFCQLSGIRQQQEICDAIETGHFLRTYNNENLNTEKFWSQTVVDIASRLLAIKPLMLPAGIVDLPLKENDYPHTLRRKPKNVHAACSWVNQVALEAKAAQLHSKEYIFRLSDFPSRQRF